MRAIALANQKGGVGKTTVAINLAAGLALLDRRVLLVDIDPQSNATYSLGTHPNNDDLGMYGALMENAGISEILVPTHLHNLSLAPASQWLIQAEAKMIEQGRLKERLEELGEDRFDYVLVDCPPNLGTLTINALKAVREVLIPVQAQAMALIGLQQLHETLSFARKSGNERLKLCGILACQADLRTRHAKEVIEQIREEFGDVVFNTVIRQNIRVAESPSFAETIFDYDANSLGAFDFKALVNEITRQEAS